MEDIQHKKRSKKYRLFYICQRVLTCIDAKIRFAMSCCSIKYIFYNFRTINTHGCPILSFRKIIKMKEYIVKKLKEQGFKVKTVLEPENGIEWSILVSW